MGIFRNNEIPAGPFFSDEPQQAAISDGLPQIPVISGRNTPSDGLPDNAPGRESFFSDLPDDRVTEVYKPPRYQESGDHQKRIIGATVVAGLLTGAAGLYALSGGSENDADNGISKSEQTVPGNTVDQQKTTPGSTTNETSTTEVDGYSPYDVITVNVTEEPTLQPEVSYFEQQQQQSNAAPPVLADWQMRIAGWEDDPVERERYINNELEILAQRSGYSCVGPDVMIPSNFGPEAVELSERFRPAYSQESYMEVVSSIESATSVEQVQEIIKSTYSSMGIEDVQFVGLLEGAPEPGEDFTPPSSSVDTYRPYAIEILKALRYIPVEMISPAGSLVLTDSVFLKEDNHAVAFHGLDNVTLGSAAKAAAVIHEFMHDIQVRACGDISPNDVELTDAYNEALLLDGSGPYNDEDRIFPSQYSAENSTELFAELGTALIMNGLRTESDLIELPTAQRNAYIKLQELVIERMQKAMPGVDVISWLQLQRMYNFEEGGSASIYERGVDQSLVALEVGENQTEQMRLPAIEIQAANGEKRYIYAHVYEGKTIIAIDRNAPSEVRDAMYEYLKAVSKDGYVEAAQVTSFGYEQKSFPGYSADYILATAETS